MIRLFASVVGISLLWCAGAPSTLDTGIVEVLAPTPEPVRAERVDDVPLRDDDIVVVAADEPEVVVLQFSDWECPHCARAWPEILAAVQAHPGTELRFRTYPLSAPCNPAVTRENGQRCLLAKAALCADRSGRFRTFAEDAFGPAGDSALDRLTSEEQACLWDDDIEARVRTHAQSGTELGVEGTPTVFVRVDGRWWQLRSAPGLAAFLEDPPQPAEMPAH